jgi:excisionase family DNA binding protein
MTEPLELAQLVDNPALAVDVPADRVPLLLIQLVAEQAKLGALEGALALRLLTASGAPGPGESPAAMLSVDEAAKRAKLSSAYFYEHADRLPFVRRIGRRVLVHEVAFQRWLDRGSPNK